MNLALLFFAFVTGLPAQDAGAAPHGPIRVSGGVMAAALISKVMPVVPPITREMDVSGVAVMHVIIGEDGHVSTVDYISGPQVLRQSYVDAVRQWSYRPYLLNGQPVEVDTTVTIDIQFGASAAPRESAQLRVHLDPAQLKDFVLHKVPPVYPAEAKQRHISGSVVMHAIISLDGHVASLTVVSGPTELRQSALDSVYQWTYKPYIVDGVAHEVETEITMNYKLSN